MRKIIQIAAEAGEGDGDYARPSVLNALCDDGTLWFCECKGGKGDWIWRQYPPIPQE